MSRGMLQKYGCGASRSLEEKHSIGQYGQERSGPASIYRSGNFELSGGQTALQVGMLVSVIQVTQELFSGFAIDRLPAGWSKSKDGRGQSPFVRECASLRQPTSDRHLIPSVLEVIFMKRFLNSSTSRDDSLVISEHAREQAAQPQTPGHHGVLCSNRQDSSMLW